jgi:hypothetical protein
MSVPQDGIHEFGQRSTNSKPTAKKIIVPAGSSNSSSSSSSAVRAVGGVDLEDIEEPELKIIDPKLKAAKPNEVNSTAAASASTTQIGRGPPPSSEAFANSTSKQTNEGVSMPAPTAPRQPRRPQENTSSAVGTTAPTSESESTGPRPIRGGRVETQPGASAPGAPVESTGQLEPAISKPSNPKSGGVDDSALSDSGLKRQTQEKPDTASTDASKVVGTKPARAARAAGPISVSSGQVTMHAVGDINDEQPLNLVVKQSLDKPTSATEGQHTTKSSQDAGATSKSVAAETPISRSADADKGNADLQSQRPTGRTPQPAARTDRVDPEGTGAGNDTTVPKRSKLSNDTSDAISAPDSAAQKSRVAVPDASTGNSSQGKPSRAGTIEASAVRDEPGTNAGTSKVAKPGRDHPSGDEKPPAAIDKPSVSDGTGGKDTLKVSPRAQPEKFASPTVQTQSVNETKRKQGTLVVDEQKGALSADGNVNSPADAEAEDQYAEDDGNNEDEYDTAEYDNDSYEAGWMQGLAGFNLRLQAEYLIVSTFFHKEFAEGDFAWKYLFTDDYIASQITGSKSKSSSAATVVSSFVSQWNQIHGVEAANKLAQNVCAALCVRFGPCDEAITLTMHANQPNQRSKQQQLVSTLSNYTYSKLRNYCVPTCTINIRELYQYLLDTEALLETMILQLSRFPVVIEQAIASVASSLMSSKSDSQEIIAAQMLDIARKKAGLPGVRLEHSRMMLTVLRIESSVGPDKSSQSSAKTPASINAKSLLAAINGFVGDVEKRSPSQGSKLGWLGLLLRPAQWSTEDGNEGQQVVTAKKHVILLASVLPPINNINGAISITALQDLLVAVYSKPSTQSSAKSSSGIDKKYLLALCRCWHSNSSWTNDEANLDTIEQFFCPNGFSIVMRTPLGTSVINQLTNEGKSATNDSKLRPSHTTEVLYTIASKSMFLKLRKHRHSDMYLRVPSDICLYLDAGRSLLIPKCKKHTLINFVNDGDKVYCWSDYVDKLLEQELEEAEKLEDDEVAQSAPQIPIEVTQSGHGGRKTPTDEFDKSAKLADARHKMKEASKRALQDSGDEAADGLNKLERTLNRMLKVGKAVEMPPAPPFPESLQQAHTWGVPMTVRYLSQEIELPDYDSIFLRHELDGLSFIGLDRDAVERLGVNHPLHVAKLCAHVDKLRDAVLTRALRKLPSHHKNWETVHLAAWLSLKQECPEAGACILKHKTDYSDLSRPLKKSKSDDPPEKIVEDLAAKLLESVEKQQRIKATTALKRLLLDHDDETTCVKTVNEDESQQGSKATSKRRKSKGAQKETDSAMSAISESDAEPKPKSKAMTRMKTARLEQKQQQEQEEMASKDKESEKAKSEEKLIGKNIDVTKAKGVKPPLTDSDHSDDNDDDLEDVTDKWGSSMNAVRGSILSSTSRSQQPRGQPSQSKQQQGTGKTTSNLLTELSIIDEEGSVSEEPERSKFPQAEDGDEEIPDEVADLKKPRTQQAYQAKKQTKSAKSPSPLMQEARYSSNSESESEKEPPPPFSAVRPQAPQKQSDMAPAKKEDANEMTEVKEVKDVQAKPSQIPQIASDRLPKSEQTNRVVPAKQPQQATHDEYDEAEDTDDIDDMDDVNEDEDDGDHDERFGKSALRKKQAKKAAKPSKKSSKKKLSASGSKETVHLDAVDVNQLELQQTMLEMMQQERRMFQERVQSLEQIVTQQQQSMTELRALKTELSKQKQQAEQRSELLAKQNEATMSGLIGMRNDQLSAVNTLSNVTGMLVSATDGQITAVKETLELHRQQQQQQPQQQSSIQAPIPQQYQQPPQTQIQQSTHQQVMGQSPPVQYQMQIRDQASNDSPLQASLHAPATKQKTLKHPLHVVSPTVHVDPLTSTQTMLNNSTIGRSTPPLTSSSQIGSGMQSFQSSMPIESVRAVMDQPEVPQQAQQLSGQLPKQPVQAQGAPKPLVENMDIRTLLADRADEVTDTWRTILHSFSLPISPLLGGSHFNAQDDTRSVLRRVATLWTRLGSDLFVFANNNADSHDKNKKTKIKPNITSTQVDPLEYVEEELDLEDPVVDSVNGMKRTAMKFLKDSRFGGNKRWIGCVCLK